jgi:hypothetical protein
MPTYIKTGFWEKARKGYKEWLNLDQFIESKIPVPTYKVYTALLTQTGEDAPTAIVLENTLGGNIVWSRDNEGSYIATLNGAFVEDKTFTLINATEDGEDLGTDAAWSKRGSNNTVLVRTGRSLTQASDNRLQKTSFEIRVYN